MIKLLLPLLLLSSCEPAYAELDEIAPPPTAVIIVPMPVAIVIAIIDAMQSHCGCHSGTCPTGSAK